MLTTGFLIATLITAAVARVWSFRLAVSGTTRRSILVTISALAANLWQSSSGPSGENVVFAIAITALSLPWMDELRRARQAPLNGGGSGG